MLCLRPLLSRTTTPPSRRRQIEDGVAAGVFIAQRPILTRLGQLSLRQCCSERLLSL